MPLYEYRCSSCALLFEELVGHGTTSVPCPVCGAPNAERQLSTFASPSGTGGPLCAEGPCGAGGCDVPMAARSARSGCCGGACHH